MSSPALPILEDFGMTRYEAAVYMELLRLGQTGAGAIIRRTGIHRQFVYSALATLVERGLVGEQVSNRQKLFHVSDPREIVRRERERFRSVQSILPELLALQPKGAKSLSLETFTGNEEFYSSLLSSVDSAARSDSLIRIMGGGSGSEFYTILGERYEDYVRYVKKLKVSKRLIASVSSSEEYERRYAKEKKAELRIVRFGLTAPSYTRMTKELVDIMVFGDEPLVIRIWNKTIARSYIEHFELLWRAAETVSAGLEKKARRSAPLRAKKAPR